MTPARSNLTTYLITGANRGLGLEFVRQLSSRPSTLILAGVRSPPPTSSHSPLSTLAAANPNLHILPLDTSSPGSITAFTALATNILGQGAPLHYLVNNAGINAHRDTTALTLTPEVLHSHIQTNVIGPALLAQALLPQLHAGSVVLNMSSGLGSCTEQSDPQGNGVTAAAYSISKAALNMLTVQQAGAVELGGRGVCVVSMDPGWVRTDMGGSNARLEAVESIGGMLNVMDGLAGEKGRGKGGRYLRWDGSEVPW